MSAVSFSVGSNRCLLLSAGQFDVSAPVLFANAPAAELAVALERFGLVPERIVFPVHPLFVDTGTNRVLIDPGTTDDPARLLAALREAGVDPAGIDTIVITHGHADHFSGAVLADGGAAFPTARHFMQRAEWDHAEKIAAIAQADVASARAREISVKDRIPAVLAYGITGGFFTLLVLLIFRPIPVSNQELLYVLLGALATSQAAIVGYYFGSSAGSAQKTDMMGKFRQEIAKAAAEKPQA